ncbi:zonular occludens toxin domain-containing protein [Clostridium botulinum]|nr:zonular occludens toxin domain-containing protein [Clostridium botulinum]MBY6935738.1 hypothetical protein [Clostridium botulinum]NFN13290.1 hypothetical protein [Clostridium botulinum]NFT66183.1 hypothetical protein [Clostridium botulinum]
MIYFYSGTPGSGKSLQMAHTAVEWLKKYKKNVIANTRINIDKILKKKKGGNFFYLPNENFSTEYLYEYALKYHEMGIEHQSLIIIDEAQCLFSPTAVKLFTQENKHYRQEWLEFFTQHRHLGFDIIIISQFDRLIDAQVRCLFEYNCVHRKANNFGFIGMILTIFHVPLFVQVNHWYGVNQVTSKKFFTYSKKYADIYDSYAYRNEIIKKLEKKYGKEKMEELMGWKRKSKKEKLDSKGA